MQNIEIFIDIINNIIMESDPIDALIAKGILK